MKNMSNLSLHTFKLTKHLSTLFFHFENGPYYVMSMWKIMKIICEWAVAKNICFLIGNSKGIRLKKEAYKVHTSTYM